MPTRTLFMAQILTIGTVSLLWGCFEATERRENTTGDTDSETYKKVEIERRVGFVTIPARKVTAPGLPETQIATAEIFYHLMPAQEKAAQKPVIVIFNGGPGGGTSGLLQLTGTGPYSLDTETWTLTETEHPFTEFANLLYIDARQTGFSFSRALPGTDPQRPPDAQMQATFNNYTDAADVILAILGVLHAQPPLHNADVIIMAESFGGIRAQYMFDLLLRPAQLLTTTVYRDDALLEQLADHYAVRFPQTPFEALTPEIVAEQFGRQILIQPGFLLPDSRGYCNVCRCERGDLDCPAVYSILDIRKKESWLFEHLAALPDFLLNEEIFETLFGTPPDQIEFLTPAGRTDAYRLDAVNAPADWVASQGALGENDTYFVPLSEWANMYLTPNMTVDRTGDLLIRNGVRLDTFITRAYYDAVTNLDDLPAGMRYTSGFMHPKPLLRDAYLDTQAREGVERPGWAYLTYTEAAGIPEERQVEWRMPFYKESGHMVTADQPTDFYNDVAAFLRETGAID